MPKTDRRDAMYELRDAIKRGEVDPGWEKVGLFQSTRADVRTEPAEYEDCRGCGTMAALVLASSVVLTALRGML